jgi:hypothetical protein
VDTEETTFGATGRHRSSPATDDPARRLVGGFFGRTKGVPMTEHPGVPPDHRRIERAIVLQLLRDDHDERWSCTELHAALDNIEPSALAEALERLERHGVALTPSADAILASPCARRLDELELIGV